jgi:glycylpeptide N-tetradecanoyltransferase
LKTGDVKRPIAAKEEGPLKEVDISKVPKQPSPLPDGFEWVTTDISDKNEVSL